MVCLLLVIHSLSPGVSGQVALAALIALVIYHLTIHTRDPPHRMRSTTAESVPTGHSVILYMLSVPHALLIALWLQVHTKGGKVRYKYSSAGTAWSL